MHNFGWGIPELSIAGSCGTFAAASCIAGLKGLREEVLDMHFGALPHCALF